MTWDEIGRNVGDRIFELEQQIEDMKEAYEKKHGIFSFFYNDIFFVMNILPKMLSW